MMLNGDHHNDVMEGNQCDEHASSHITDEKEDSSLSNLHAVDEQDKKSKKFKGIEVFAGDISFFCKEVDLYKLFSQYGRVMRTRIKRSDKNGRTLMYGFVDMERLDDANRCIKALHGSRFQGRDIRVELSGSRAPAQPARPNHEDYHQIYISFKSEEGNPEGSQLPTESLLRDVFEQYSPVKDIAIKEYSFDKTTNIQQGFCFAAFYSLVDAKRVFNTIHGHCHRGFLFSCSVSYHFPLGDDRAVAPINIHPRERLMTSSQTTSPRATPASHHQGRQSWPQSPNLAHEGRKNAVSESPVMMYPPYVNYAGMMPYGHVNGMPTMYPHMHMVPSVFSIPVAHSDGFVSVPIPVVPPPPGSYSPSQSQQHHNHAYIFPEGSLPSSSAPPAAPTPVVVAHTASNTPQGDSTQSTSPRAAASAAAATAPVPMLVNNVNNGNTPLPPSRTVYYNHVAPNYSAHSTYSQNASHSHSGTSASSIDSSSSSSLPSPATNYHNATSTVNIKSKSMSNAHSKNHDNNNGEAHGKAAGLAGVVSHQNYHPVNNNNYYTTAAGPQHHHQYNYNHHPQQIPPLHNGGRGDRQSHGNQYSHQQLNVVHSSSTPSHFPSIVHPTYLMTDHSDRR